MQWDWIWEEKVIPSTTDLMPYGLTKPLPTPNDEMEQTTKIPFPPPPFL